VPSYARRAAIAAAALLLLLGAGGTPAPLTLVAAQRDANGYPLDPHWAYQELPDASRAGPLYVENHCPSEDTSADHPCAGRLLLADRACGNFVPQGASPSFDGCTTDRVTVDERPRPALWFFSGTIAYACYHLIDGPEELLPGSVHGHIDWGPATFDGTLRFSDSNAVGSDDGPRGPSFLKILPIGDGDLDFMLEPLDGQAGLLAGNRTASHVGMLGNDGLTIEMNLPEVLDPISGSPFWSSFAQHLPQYARRVQTLPPMPAIVIGLFGIDTKHLSHTELHPVYGLAVETQNTASVRVWDVFARNWGYEGSCSSALHVLEQGDEPARQLTFTLAGSQGYTPDMQASYGNDAGSWSVAGSPETIALTARLSAPSQRAIAWYHLVLRRAATATR
jgi:hypothetical protein